MPSAIDSFSDLKSPSATEISLDHDHSPATSPRTASSEAGQGVLPIRVFVHLAYGFDARAWHRRWLSGELVGVNEPTPYGYGRAKGRVRELGYSHDRSEGRIGRLLRLAVRALLGFDMLHAWSNRRAIAASDVVWTHTESQFLAIALLAKMTRGPRPALIGQSVWLFDRWEALSSLRRRFYAWLIQEVDVLTVHSPENFSVVRGAFPEKACELVLFGICTDHPRQPAIRGGGPDEPFRVLAVGNDRHRDWKTAVDAVRGLDGVRLTIVSSTAPAALAQDVPNVTVRTVRSNAELEALYASCDAVLVPLARNLHASGITVLQEAALYGVPVLASDTGGLRAYFGDGEVVFVPVGDPAALRAEILSLKNDEGRRLALARRAQARMGADGLGSQAFVERHLEISKTLVGNDRKVT